MPDVRMNNGEVLPINSNDELRTQDFGGCTAIYAKNDSMFGLYHLQTIADRPDNTNNVTYKEWLLKLKELSGGQPIYFEIGTPKNKKGLEHHPYLGMERYLRSLCETYGIQIAEIKLLDMNDVESISVTKQQMTCFSERGYKDAIPTIHESDSQTDEAMLEKLEEMDAISSILGDPNMDLDGTLKTKYQDVYDQYWGQLSSQREELLINLRGMINSDNSNDRNSFLDELYRSIRSMDFVSIKSMTKHSYFKEITHDERRVYYSALDLATRASSLQKELKPLPEELEKYNPLDNSGSTPFKSKYMQLKEGGNTNTGPEQNSETCTIL
ncbi:MULTISPECIES: hypothetical protein [Legionella]|uniref:Dot/Icm T4SS effector n=1 Tax=Legionella resiliens TaxID=2905958 RepID=A0ABS8X574_9GAMM|nr:MULTISPECIES: hypothetical protein [unclassified Legionella]MCE0722851.1 hypothetical protein [Legionella sp. 9fVS26]MCE3532004.1 hypothetical protein [Legionella sp. 8cVS16]QLZ68122.1 hypothetical protein FOLKNPGA_00900 [Legionella sp. PC1000]